MAFAFRYHGLAAAMARSTAVVVIAVGNGDDRGGELSGSRQAWPYSAILYNDYLERIHVQCLRAAACAHRRPRGGSTPRSHVVRELAGGEK